MFGNCDLSTATVVLKDVQEDIVVRNSSPDVAAPSGDGAGSDAMLPDNDDDAMSLDV